MQLSFSSYFLNLIPNYATEFVLPILNLYQEHFTESENNDPGSSIEFINLINYLIRLKPFLSSVVTNQEDPKMAPSKNNLIQIFEHQITNFLTSGEVKGNKFYKNVLKSWMLVDPNSYAISALYENLVSRNENSNKALTQQQISIMHLSDEKIFGNLDFLYKKLKPCLEIDFDQKNETFTIEYSRECIKCLTRLSISKRLSNEIIKGFYQKLLEFVEKTEEIEDPDLEPLKIQVGKSILKLHTKLTFEVDSVCENSITSEIPILSLAASLKALLSLIGASLNVRKQIYHKIYILFFRKQILPLFLCLLAFSIFEPDENLRKLVSNNYLPECIEWSANAADTCVSTTIYLLSVRPCYVQGEAGDLECLGYVRFLGGLNPFS